MTKEEIEEVRRRSLERPFKPPSRRALALIDRALEQLGERKRRPANGLLVVEVDAPHRASRVGIVLHALDIPWLKEKGDLKIDGHRVYADRGIVAWIISASGGADKDG